MSWTPFTENDLNLYLATSQLRALKTKALSPGQTDPLPDLIAQIITQIRQTIASAGYPLETAADTVPELLKSAVAALVIELAQTRLPGLTLTAEQKAQVSAAKGVLSQILARKLAIEAPATPDYTLVNAGPSAHLKVIKSRKQKTTTEELKQLS